MAGKILIVLMCILFFFPTLAKANSVEIQLSVTMPNVISGNLDNAIQSPQPSTDKIVIVETVLRNGESVTLQSIVAK